MVPPASSTSMADPMGLLGSILLNSGGSRKVTITKLIKATGNRYRNDFKGVLYPGIENKIITNTCLC
jgi:hypothetical protein